MEGFTDVAKIQIKQTALPKQDGLKNSAPVKTEPVPNDSVELSTKKEDKNGLSAFAKVAAMLGVISVAVAGGTYGGVKLYDKFFQRLSCGIKKGEINDALFNFIKKIDPKGNVFNNKAEIVKINENLTDENFVILKQLSKMKNERVIYLGPDDYFCPRFELSDITELLTNTNEYNIKYLEQLAKKSDKKYGIAETFETSDMVEILKNINPENDKVAGKLIDITPINSSKNLINCLKQVNKENSDIYSMLLSTRRKGGNTELTIQDLQSVAETLQKTKNLKCAELFLNAEKNDGTGLFRHSIEDVNEFLTLTGDENYEALQKLYALRCTVDVRDLKPLISSVNETNLDLVEPLLTKKCEGEIMGKFVVFDDWGIIKDVLMAVNKDNKDIASDLISIMDTQKMYGTNTIISVDSYFSELLRRLSNNPEEIKRASSILQEGAVDGKPTINIKDFYKKFENVSDYLY